MSKFGKQLSIAASIILLLLLLSSMFVVKQDQKALVLVLGDLKKDQNNSAQVYAPGLHFKLPLLSRVKMFDARIQGFNSGMFSALTLKQTFLEVAYYVKWRINNVELYYKRTGGMSQKAESLMEPKINDIVRAQFGKRTSDEIISTDREVIMDQVLAQARENIAKEYGVEIIDVRLQSVKLPARVLKSVFTRMASERKQFANNKRAEGMKAAESIRATADQKVVVIKATANKEAAEIKAKGEGQAASIYAKAYGANQDFYGFYRSLEAYKNAFAQENGDILVLSPDSEFFKYFNSQSGKAAAK